MRGSQPSCDLGTLRLCCNIVVVGVRTACAADASFPFALCAPVSVRSLEDRLYSPEGPTAVPKDLRPPHEGSVVDNRTAPQTYGGVNGI